MLFDATRCIGCGECAKACKSVNGLPSEMDEDLTAYTYTVVRKKEGQYTRRLCMHCLNPTCVSVCPVAALKQEKDGQVTYDAKACMGCRYCIFACPFDVPRYEWDQAFPKVGKCNFCFDRTAKGGETACSWVCPMGATVSGKRDELLKIAHERIQAHPERYVDHIYGEREAGGTSVLMLSGVPFELSGFKTNIQTEALPELTWGVLSKLPYICLNAAVLLGGLSWVIRRRIYLENHPEVVEKMNQNAAEEEENG